MGDYNNRSDRPMRRSYSGGGGRSFGGGGRDYNSRGSDRPMHPAVCSKCGKDCQVPFKPTGRPVFCSDCFRANRDADPRGAERSNFSRPRFEDRGENRSEFKPRNAQYPQFKEQFEMLNSKIDKILGLLTSVVPTEEEAKTQEIKLVETVEGLPEVILPPPPPVKKKRTPKIKAVTPEG